MSINIQDKRVGHLSALLAAVFFALNVPATNYILNGWLTPLAYALVRMVGGVVVCWGLSIFVHGKVEPKKELLYFLLAGVFGMGLFFYLYAIGMDKTTPIDASILLTLSPVLVLLISAVAFKERITRRKLIGILIAMCGAISVIVLQGEGETSGGVIGNIFILVSATVYALYLVFTGDISKRYNPIVMLRWVSLFAIIAYSPFCIEPLIESPLVSNAELIPILVAIFIAVFPSAVAFILLLIAMKSLSTTIVSMYNYSIPIIASVVSIALGEDVLHWIDPIAAVLVIFGVYLVNSSTLKNNKEDKRQYP